MTGDEKSQTGERIFGMTEEQIIKAVKDRGDIMDSNKRKTEKSLIDVVRSGVEMLKKDSKYCESIKVR